MLRFALFIAVYWLLAVNSIVNAQSTDSVQIDWIRQYHSAYPYAIAVDATGNVFVTGGSYGSNPLPDIVTIKYSGEGDTLWVRHYNGPGDNWDHARDITVDAAGNVYVTGETYSDSTYFNYVTIKYDASGNQLWVAQYDGPSNNDDGALALTIDDSGNVYVTGHSWYSGTSWDYATIKYNSSGQQQWVARYNGLDNSGDFATALAVDVSGNVYVTGSSDETSFSVYPAYATVKYNKDGVQQWAARYSVLWSYASAIAVDTSGNAYVTGRSYALGTYYDYATVKYNTMGVEQWVARYNGPGTSDDYANALTIDASGNVYVTGEAFFEAGAGSDYTTIKYNASGIEQWVARYNGPGNTVDVGNAIALDVGGNVYVTGGSRNADGDDDYATVKYNPAGIEQWIALYNGPGNTFDLAVALAVDESGGVYVTGRSTEIGVSVITTIKYEHMIIPVELSSFTASVNNNSVILNWITSTESNNSGFEVQRKVGSLQSSVSNSDFKSVAFVEGNGTTTETNHYSFEDKNLSSGKYFYRLKQIDFDGTYEYSGIVEAEVNTPVEFSLSQNYPNPFNPSTIISWQSPVAGYQTLKVYDILGNEVAALVDEYKPSGSYEIDFNAEALSSGIYFYKIQAGSFNQVKKMLLVK